MKKSLFLLKLYLIGVDFVKALIIVGSGSLFPFDGGGGLGGDVVNDSVDAPDLVDDAVGDGGQGVVGESCPVRGHGVQGVDGPYGAGVFVCALVAHDAHGAAGEKDGEGLPDGLVVGKLFDLFLDPEVGLLQQFDFFLGHFAKDPDAKAGAGEGLAV